MIEVYTRSYTPTLYSMMAQLLPKEEVILKPKYKFDRTEDCYYYLHYIIQEGSGYILNVDDDCFIINWEEIKNLINYMKDNGYDYCGMPDGGVVSTRCRNWVSCNPFFLVINADKIKSNPDFNNHEKILSHVYKKEMEERKPDFVDLNKSHIDWLSPFSPFFFWLFENFNPLYLKAKRYEDMISTILLSHQEKPIAIHTWYSREYSQDYDTKRRIDTVYEYAKSIQSK